jgi:4-oxalocrotonate tautomerase
VSEDALRDKGLCKEDSMRVTLGVLDVGHPRNAATARRMEQLMPIVRVEMWEGRTLEQKRTLVKEMTELMARVTHCDPSTVRVLISDYSVQDWGVGGVLAHDRRDPEREPRTECPGPEIRMTTRPRPPV